MPQLKHLHFLQEDQSLKTHINDKKGNQKEINIIEIKGVLKYTMTPYNLALRHPYKGDIGRRCSMSFERVCDKEAYFHDCTNHNV